MLLKTLTAVALTLSCLSVASAAEPSALADFTFQGMGFGTSLAEFQQEYPGAIVNPNRTELAVNKKSFIVTSSSFADCLMFDFAGDKLFCIGLLYQPARIQKMGGYENLASRLVQAFGTAAGSERDTDGLTTAWLDQQANRTAGLFVDNNGQTVLLVSDNAVEKLLNERRAKTTNLGF